MLEPEPEMEQKKLDAWSWSLKFEFQLHSPDSEPRYFRSQLEEFFESNETLHQIWILMNSFDLKRVFIGTKVCVF